MASQAFPLALATIGTGDDTNAFLTSSLFEATDQRLYQRQVDSVEITGDRAVVISDRKDSAAFVETWRVRVFGLNASTGLVTLTNGFYEGDTANGLNRAHDLAIDKGFDKALIRTSTENVIITSIQTPPFNFTSLVGTVVSDAHAYLSFTPGGYDSFSSDSVAISAEQAGGVLMAASIGAKQATTGAWVGYTDIIPAGAHAQHYASCDRFGFAVADRLRSTRSRDVADHEPTRSAILGSVLLRSERFATGG